MKACPVCHALSFDDGDVCYGCMHRFNSEPIRDYPADELIWEPDEGMRSNEAACGETVRIVGDIDRPEDGLQDRNHRKTPAPSTNRVLSSDEISNRVTGFPVPLDGAGWIVRFELPGRVPKGRSSKEMMACKDGPAGEKTSSMCPCSDERKMCSFSISILPACEADEKRSGTCETGEDRPVITNVDDASRTIRSRMSERLHP